MRDTLGVLLKLTMVIVVSKLLKGATLLKAEATKSALRVSCQARLDAISQHWAVTREPPDKVEFPIAAADPIPVIHLLIGRLCSQAPKLWQSGAYIEPWR
jgi:hypothetical protein